MADGENFRKIKWVIYAGLFILGLIAVLIVASFSYLDYYEMGFKRQKSTGSVDKSEVYEVGRHFIGPDFEFKIFPADLHYVKIDSAKVFTADRLEVEVWVTFQYIIRKDELVDLHDAYDLDYEDIMESSALDALKGAFTVFNTSELYSERATMEQTAFKAIRERLGGTCCNSFCNRENPLCSNCLTVCKPSDKGLHVEVKYFQLLAIRIPSDLEQQLINKLVLQEQAEEEEQKQEAVIVRKETSQRVQVIQNEAAEISQNATAQAALVTTLSQANYTVIIESARSDGLRGVFTEMNFTQQDHKNSFDYLRTMRGQEHAHFTVNYQQRIAGNIG